MSKRALILDGGGMQGAFMAGVLDEFYRSGVKENTFNLCVGTSAGAFCAAYYLTGQMKEGLRIWKKHLPNGFIVWKNFHPFYDLDYLRKIITKLEPLDLKKLRRAKSKLIVSLTKPGNSNTQFADLKKSGDIIGILLAGVSAPILTNKVQLEGQVYYDGGFTSQPPISYPGLDKFSKKLILLTYPNGFRMKTWAWEIGSLLLLKEPKLRKMVAKTPSIGNKILRKIENDKSFFKIQPDNNLPGGWLEKNASKIAANVEIGQKSAEDFLSKNKRILFEIA